MSLWRKAWRGTIRLLWPRALRVIDSFNRANGTVLSGYFAYVAMLALFPFLIFATALTGVIVGEAGSAAAIDAIFDPLPEHVRQTLAPVLGNVLGHRRLDIMTFAGLGALWAASNGLDAVRIGFDEAYAVDKRRRYALNRVYLFGMVILCVFAFIVLSVLIILAPLVLAAVQKFVGIDVPRTLTLVRYGVSIALLVTVLWSMHRLLPSRPMSGITLWPGILVGVVLWGAVAAGMSAYVSFTPTYSLTYGALAGVVVTLLFFYFTGVALILGAHVNAVVNGLDRPAASGPPDA